MATITGAGEWYAKHAHRVTWEDLANGDDGSPHGIPTLHDKTVHVLGNFGTGGTVILEGSNDGGTTWTALDDGHGNAIEFTDEGIQTFHSAALLIRPRVTAGDGATSLSVYLSEVHG